MTRLPRRNQGVRKRTIDFVKSISPNTQPDDECLARQAVGVEVDATDSMTLMHARAGYRHQSFLNDLWAVMVDAVVIGILWWVATGLYMWWQQRNLRTLGGIALGRV